MSATLQNCQTLIKFPSVKGGKLLHVFITPCLSQAANKAAASLTDVILETHRKKHMAFLMADLGVLVDKESAKQMPRDVSLKASCILLR